MRSYRSCVSFDKACYIKNESKKCVKYVKSNHEYNLTISSISIKKNHDKRLRLKREMREAYIKLDRLKKQLNFLKNKEKKRFYRNKKTLTI